MVDFKTKFALRFSTFHNEGKNNNNNIYIYIYIYGLFEFESLGHYNRCPV